MRSCGGEGFLCRSGVTVHFGNMESDFSYREVLVGGELVAMFRKEYQLLAALVGAHGGVGSVELLFGGVWDEMWPGANRALEVLIAKLRTKTNSPGPWY